MNLVETYVTNITDVQEIKTEWGYYYKISCDTNCYGQKKLSTEISVIQSEFNMIKSKGYYLT